LSEACVTSVTIIRAGEAGFPYNVLVNGTNSTYNIWGSTRVEVDPIPQIAYRTWSVHTSRTPVPASGFNKLSLRGRIRLSTGTCPLYLWNNERGSCENCTSTAKLEINQPSGSFYGIGRHRLIHLGATSVSTGLSPARFYTEVASANTPSTLERWKGAGLGCGANPAAPSDSD
jgi:hypothetical protein